MQAYSCSIMHVSLRCALPVPGLLNESLERSLMTQSSGTSAAAKGLRPAYLNDAIADYRLRGHANKQSNHSTVSLA